MNAPNGNGARPPHGDEDYDNDDGDDEAFTRALLAAARDDEEALEEAVRDYLRATTRFLAECPLYPELIIGSCSPPNRACPVCHPAFWLPESY
jgi:hypothetical protein